MVRVPSLHLPLVLGGAVLALIFFIWWLAGALSDMMFGFEPAARPVESQLVVTTEQSLAVEKTKVVTEDQGQLREQEQLKEREQLKEQNQLIAAERESESPRAPVASEQIVKKGQSPVNAQPVQTPPVVKALVINQATIDRRAVSRATTPYGMAEEAFLDGKWALEQQRSSLAVWFLQHALELYPGHLPARELLIEILDKDGETGEVMFLLAEGLEIAPDYIVFKKSYARLLVDQGDYDAAARVMLYDGLPTVEEDPEAHVFMAHLYQRLGESFLAAQTYRNLLVAWPQTGVFWVGLGGALEGQNLPEKAVECYQKALKTKNLRQDLSRYAKKRLSLLAR